MWAPPSDPAIGCQSAAADGAAAAGGRTCPCGRGRGGGPRQPSSTSREPPWLYLGSFTASPSRSSSSSSEPSRRCASSSTTSTPKESSRKRPGRRRQDLLPRRPELFPDEIRRRRMSSTPAAPSPPPRPHPGRPPASPAGALGIFFLRHVIQENVKIDSKPPKSVQNHSQGVICPVCTILGYKLSGFRFQGELCPM